MSKILIVEDDRAISNLIKIALSKAGHNCDCVFDGLKACNEIENIDYDLLLLDIMLPELDGYDVMHYAKSVNTPVIFLTAMASTNDKVKGLRMGAEDYITKPFELAELIARVENVLERNSKSDSKVLLHGITIDSNRKFVERNGRIIILSPLEFDMLNYLIINIDKPLSREQIYSNVWGGEFNVNSRTVDMNIIRLKRKLEWEKELISVYKLGYRLIRQL